MLILYLLSITTSTLFLMMSHPMSMGLIIIIQTFLISIIIGISFSNFWYSYILYLIYLGGLLILFLYIASLVSNEYFSFKNEKKKLLSIFPIFLLIILYFDMSQNLDSQPMILQMSSLFNETFSYLYSQSVSKIILFLSIYLLICLIGAVKICSLIKGPMRQTF